jgi:carboxypeptidase C (cathepsin A)
MASLLLVDSPAGVGYSYAENEDDYITNDTNRIVDLYDFLSKVRVVYNHLYIVIQLNHVLIRWFLTQWFAEYTEFMSNPFYVAGCSYSGVIVPVLAQEIVKSKFQHCYDPFIVQYTDVMCLNLKFWQYLGNEEPNGMKINFKVIRR